MDVDNSPNRKPDGHLMLGSVRSILSSGRSDDEISGELAELLGFDQLELVSDILSNRGQFLGKPGVVDGPILTPLPPKGEGNEIGNSSPVAAMNLLMLSTQTRGALLLVRPGDAWKNSYKRMLPGHCSLVLQ